jgi:hypothetical protein
MTSDENRSTPEPTPAAGDDHYNTGTEDDRRRALDSIYDYNKTLITLATGTIALSATFLGREIPRGGGTAWLVASWVVLLISILLGIVGMGQYINQYAESRIKPRRSGVEYISLAQILILLVGLGCLAYFATQNIGRP